MLVITKKKTEKEETISIIIVATHDERRLETNDEQRTTATFTTIIGLFNLYFSKLTFLLSKSVTVKSNIVEFDLPVLQLIELNFINSNLIYFLSTIQIMISKIYLNQVNYFHQIY